MRLDKFIRCLLDVLYIKREWTHSLLFMCILSAFFFSIFAWSFVCPVFSLFKISSNPPPSPQPYSLQSKCHKMLRPRSKSDPHKFLKRRIFHLRKPFIRNRANCALFSIQKLVRFLGSIPCKRKANPCKFLSVQDFPRTRGNRLC